MRILLLTGVVFPLPSNNANLLSKLIPFLKQEHEVRLLAAEKAQKGETLPELMYGVPVYWIREIRSAFKRRWLVPAAAKIRDQQGLSDVPIELTIRENLKQVRRQFCYDVVITTMEPYADGMALAKLPVSVKKILYLMDPPAPVIREFKGSPYRTRSLPRIIRHTDLILTTPAISSALQEAQYAVDGKLSVVGFPMIQEYANTRTENDVPMDPEKINLLFCGWLYARIRSPEFYLKIVEKLDERFCVYFIGRDCEKLFERFQIETKARVICLPQQDYQTALNAMHDADVLVNIGNSVSVHMPSKVLEYINTGKPIISFCKIPDCPSRYYTSKYPSCLEIDENYDLLQQAAERVLRFCEQSKNTVPVERETIEKRYSDCTPAAIAGRMLSFLDGSF